MEGWLIMSGIKGGKILCFQCTDLSKICLVSKFYTNRPNIEQVMSHGTLGSERIERKCKIWSPEGLLLKRKCEISLVFSRP